MNRYRVATFTVAILASVSGAGIANAQAADPAATDGATDVPAEPADNVIIVTAQRRNERLQDVPLAMSAFNEQSLDAGKVENVADLNAQVPNVSFAPVGAFQFAGSFAIRGLGFADVESSFEPTVGTEIDGVYISRNVGALMDLFDVESIQILRGPQGTFFGRNTVGGVISVKSARPDGTFGGKGQLTVGNFGRRELRGMVQTPITDGVAFKVAGLVKNYDGYIHNDDGRDMPRERTRSVRGMLTYNSGLFDATLIGDYTRLRGSGVALQNVSLPNQVLSLRGYPADASGDPYHSHIGDPNTADLDVWGVTLDMNLETPVGKLTSITGYRDTDQSTRSDFDGEEIRFFQVDRDEQHYQFSQEIRLAGDTGNLNYVVGAFYMEQEYDLANHQYGTLFGSPDAGSTANIGQRAEAWALFGQLDYEIVTDLTLTLGGRWGHERKAFHTQPLFFTETRYFNKSFSDFLPKASVNYKITPDIMVYALYSEGYRSGGFNGRASNFRQVGPYDPERLKNYELGFKSQLFDRMLTLNASVFQMDYSDQQVAVQENIGNVNQTIVRNAASSRYKGAELETALRVDGFTLTGSLGYLDAKFRNFVGNLGDGLGVIDRSNLPLTYAPKWTIGSSANWTGDVGIGELVAQVTFSHQSKQYTSFTPINAYNDLTLRPGNEKVDASLRLNLDNGMYATLWGKNLTDENIINNTFAVGSLMSLRAWSAPREYGVDVGFRF